jgi:sugar lactone lactonase YvrE
MKNYGIVRAASEARGSPRFLRVLLGLRGSGLIACAALCFACGGPDYPDLEIIGRNSIERENQHTGTEAYLVTHPVVDAEIEAYAATTSASPGDQVDLFVNVSRSSLVSWEVFRIGYYGGRGARLMQRGDSLAVDPQTPCPVDADTGLVECDWQKSLRIEVPADWITGYYLFKFTRDDGFETRVPLVIREATPSAALLVQSSVNTWQAYNRWGGTSLYRNELGPDAAFMGPHANRVSFDRPYGEDDGAGQLFGPETSMAGWLEQKGYDVAYVTNVDIDRDPSLLGGRRMFLSVGHDEYYSIPERDALEQARDNGLSLGFFSANSVYWRVRLESSSRGAPGRVMTCYKTTADPHKDAADTTTMFRASPQPRPESTLVGVMYQLDDHGGLSFPLVVGDASHWLFEGTGITSGTRLANVLGNEWDERAPASQTPDGTELVLQSPAIANLGELVLSHASVYYPSPSSLVFASGTIFWGSALGASAVIDPRIQRITENVLARAGLPPWEWTQPAPQSSAGGTASEVSLIAGTGEAGHLDGPADVAQFDAPAGVVATEDGTLYVTEVGNHDIRRIDADGTVSTLAGCGPDGHRRGKFRDAKGRKACFDTPTSIAAGPDGALYVSDTSNDRIRRVTVAGRVTTYAGGKGGYLDSPDRLQARFIAPRGIASGPDGELYVVEPRGNVRRIDANGVTTVATNLPDPTAVAVDPNGVIYVTCRSTGAVYRLGSEGPEILANDEHIEGDSEGPALSAQLRPLEGLLVDGDQLVFSDSGNYRIRQLTLGDSGVISTLVGDGGFGQELGDGSSARVVLPRGIARYKQGYAIADSGNHRILYVRPGSPQP